MITQAYSVFDTKALQYNLPFFCPTDGAAVRLFSDLVNDHNTSVGRHPSDYVLYCIGMYDDGRGELLAHVPLRHVIDAVALVKVQPSLFQTDALGNLTGSTNMNGEAK